MSAIETFIAWTTGLAAVTCFLTGWHEADNTGYSWHTPSRVRPFAWFIIACILCGTCNAVKAQKLLWRVEVHGTDTVAVGPAGDIDSAFVRWSLRGKALRECKWDLKWKQDEVDGLYRERDKCEELRKQALRDMKAMRANEEALNDRANKWQRKAKRRKPWLFFGFGAATLYVVQQQMK